MVGLPPRPSPLEIISPGLAVMALVMKTLLPVWTTIPVPVGFVTGGDGTVVPVGFT
jgi:hypothetical protein